MGNKAYTILSFEQLLKLGKKCRSKEEVKEIIHHLFIKATSEAADRTEKRRRFQALFALIN